MTLDLAGNETKTYSLIPVDSPTAEKTSVGDIS